jgi:Ca2+-binding EF-hand superfamily protein
MLPRPAAYIRTCLFVSTCALLVVPASAQAQDDLRRLDKNGDGKLDIKFEVPEQARPAIARAAEKAGLSLSQPLPIDKLTEALRSSRDGNSSGDRPPEGRSDEGRRDEERSRDDRSREEERSRDDRSRDDRSREERYGRDRGREEERSRGSFEPSRESRFGSSNSSSNTNNKSNATGPTSAKTINGIPGFGVSANGTPLVPGFDVPLHTTTSGSQKPVEQLFDPRAVERAKRTLSENDRNKNGMLDAEELDASRWTNPPIEESDTNKDGKMSLHELCARYAKRYNWNDPPGVVKAGSSGDNHGGGDKHDDGDKTKKYAESLLKQYDENKDGLLQKDEWMKMRSDYHSADQNGDHVLTQEEIYVKLMALSGPNSGGSSSSGGNSGGSSGSRDGRGDGKPGGYGSRPGGSGSSKSGKPGESKVARVLTPTERLPKGLPDWFLRNDSDGDGQIMMAEYAPAWTDATAADFMKYDLNGDGYITPKECLAALEAMKKK